MSARSNNDMPNLNNLNRFLGKTPSRKGSPTVNNLERMLRGSPARSSTARSSPAKSFPSLSPSVFRNVNIDTLFSPVRMPSSPVAKIAPGAKRVRKIAPSPKRAASPDRKFAHKFDGTNSGEKDSFGRIIWHGPQGGKFVISAVGKRVPHIDANLKKRTNQGAMKNTGLVDRKGRKIFQGKQGGKFVITESGRRANPLK